MSWWIALGALLCFGLGAAVGADAADESYAELEAAHDELAVQFDEATTGWGNALDLLEDTIQDLERCNTFLEGALDE